jgi:para-nitrobenzyl esterase
VAAPPHGRAFAGGDDTLDARASREGEAALSGVRIGIGLVLIAAAGAAAAWLWGLRTPPEATPPVVIADVSSERLTTHGSVVGFAGEVDTHAWLGIPYAAPPVGALRWRPPVRPEPWTDTLDALAWGPPCVQLATPLGGVADAPPGTVAGSEDCLRLNVWAPRFDGDALPVGDARLPVLVWIHGGGNTVGRAGPMYDGTWLASRHRLIVVSLAYRLGPFGWFAHPAVLGGAPSGAPASGNFGTLDLIAGLEWVRDNIEAFGGDPSAVTIFGESAGGTNVVSLLVSPRARGLFARAIVQSGSTASTSVARAVHYVDDDEPGHPSSAREIVLRLLIADGSASDRASARLFADGLDSDAIATYLRGKSPEEILAAYRRTDPEGGETDADETISLPRVIRDGVVLPREPALEVMRDPRRYNAVPVILGSNRDEIKLFFSQDPEFVQRYLDVFVRLRDEDRYNMLARFHSDLWKANGVDTPASILSGAPRGDVYAYRFDWDEEPAYLGADIGTILGAGHGLEIPFVFGHFRFGGDRLSKLIFNPANWPGRKYVSDAMMSYWAEFAYTGRPGQGRARALPEWTPWRTDGEEGAFVVFDTPAGGGIRMERDRVTKESVIAAVDARAELGRLDKCRVFLNLFRYAEDWSVESFREMGREGCRDYPLDGIDVRAARSTGR